jgi:hypothetical protein
MIKQILQRMAKGWNWACNCNNYEIFCFIAGLLILCTIVGTIILTNAFITLEISMKTVRALFILLTPLPVYLYILGGRSD